MSSSGKRYRTLAVAIALTSTSLGAGAAAVPPTRCARTMAESSMHTDFYLPDPSERDRELAQERAVLAALKARHTGKRVTLAIVGRGAESLIVRVSFPRGGDVAVRVPRRSDFDRVARAYANEWRTVERARQVDPEGAEHLLLPRRLRIDASTGLPLLFLDFAPGGSLESHLADLGARRARDDPALFLELWRQMALAVRALHRIGTVHRDVKPSNFLVWRETGRWFVALTDLGLAAPEGGQVSGLEGLLSGTLSHMSDNQRRRGNASFADDLYALKMTFRETLVGRLVWHIDPRPPENHIRLEPIDEFGTYPILCALPDPVAARVPHRLRLLVERDYASIDALLDALDEADRDRR